MYRLAKMMLYDTEESRDVVSEVFARLLKGGIFPSEEKLEGYLMTSVRNRCHDVISHKTVQERVHALFLAEQREDPPVSFPYEDLLERLHLFVYERLSPLSQRIFRLRFLEQMTYQEIAEETGVSRVTVYHHLAQTLRNLQEHFNHP